MHDPTLLEGRELAKAIDLAPVLQAYRALCGADLANTHPSAEVEDKRDEKARQLLEQELREFGRIVRGPPASFLGIDFAGSTYFALIGHDVALPLSSGSGSFRFRATDLIVKRDPFGLDRRELVRSLHLTVHAVQQYAERFLNYQNSPVPKTSEFRDAEHRLRSVLGQSAVAVSTLPAWFSTRISNFYVVSNQDLVLACYYAAPHGKLFTARTAMSRVDNLTEMEPRRLARLVAIRPGVADYVARQISGSLSDGALREIIGETGKLKRAERPIGDAQLVLALGNGVQVPVIWDPAIRSRQPLELVVAEPVLPEAVASEEVSPVPSQRRLGRPSLRLKVETASAPVYAGDRLEHLLELDADEVTLGRSTDADIYVDLSKVSRLHLTFLRQGRQWYVVDEGSRNGTWFARPGMQPVPVLPGKARLLTDGATVTLGKSALVIRVSGIGDQPMPVGRRTEDEDEERLPPVLDRDHHLVGGELVQMWLGETSLSRASLAARTAIDLPALAPILERLAELPRVREHVSSPGTDAERLEVLAAALLREIPELGVQR